MTFKEYLAQTDPIKRSHGVIVTKDDCQSIWDDVHGKKVISLLINGFDYRYILKPASGLLWTIDQDGNPDSPSCFVFEE